MFWVVQQADMDSAGVADRFACDLAAARPVLLLADPVCQQRENSQLQLFRC